MTPLSDAHILDIITAHLSTTGINQNNMFLVALADMGETRRCRIKLIKGGNLSRCRGFREKYRFLGYLAFLPTFFKIDG